MADVMAAFVSDLMFQTRIEHAAENHNIQVEWIENETQMLSKDNLGLAALGSEGNLVDQLTRMGTKIVIFDLGNNAIPWSTWIKVLKTNPATKRIPIISFGSHVDVDTLKEARKSGSNEALARSRFVTSISQLIEKYYLPADLESIEITCEKTLHPDAVKGLELFNQRDFFSAHEYLEEAWKEDLSPGRDLYQGLLQVAVAYYQIQQGNFKGAVKMFHRSRQWLYHLPDTCRGVAVDRYRKNAEQIYEMLIEFGPTRIKDIPIDNIKPVIWGLN